MKGKTRDFSELGAAIAAPAADTPAPPPAPPPIAPKGAGGRPQADTTQMTLRIPRHLLDRLVDEAADATKRDRRTVTPQQLIIAALEAAYGDTDNG